MRIFILCLAFLFSFSPALAKKAPQSTFTGTPFPIDEEFQTEFTGYDEKEFKAYEKEQKVRAKIDKKRQKLEEKKAALEKKRDAGLGNCERNQLYIEKLRATIVEPREGEENL